MLHELAYKGEIHSFDLLTMECVANANSNISKSTPNETIAQMQLMFSEMQFPRKYGITREALKSLYDHSYDGDLDFAALSVCDVILNNGVILSHWGKAHVIKDETSSICAPIEINGKRYYAVLISGRKKNGLQYPYAMRVFSDEHIRNELSEIYRTSPQNEMIPRQNADFQKFAANLLINYIINNSDLSFLSNNSQNNNVEQDGATTIANNQEDITENKNMKKNRIKLTEAQLHRVIKESVQKVLREGWPDDSYGGPGDSASSGHSRLSDEDREERDLSLMLRQLISIHKYEDGHYRVLVPPHFASQMKELENKGIEFVGCQSDYTPMALYIHNEAIKNRADDMLGQICY